MKEIEDMRSSIRKIRVLGKLYNQILTEDSSNDKGLRKIKAEVAKKEIVKQTYLMNKRIQYLKTCY